MAELLLKLAGVALLAAHAAAAACNCKGREYASEPTVTCTAMGDPHYRNIAGKKFDFYARGLFEHAKFDVDFCECDVEIQVMLSKLVGGRYAANSGIAATAVRTGDTTFMITGSGDVLVTSGGGGGTTALQPMSVASTHTFGETSISREKQGSRWAWRILLPGRSGSYLVAPSATWMMADGFLYNVWLTVADAIANGDMVGGLCFGSCPRTHIPVLPFTSCGQGLPLRDECYPVTDDDALFSPSVLHSLEESNNIVSSTRDCDPLPPSAPPSPPKPPTPPKAPATQCIGHYLNIADKPQLGATNGPTNSEYIKLPNVQNIQSLTLWFYPENEQDAFEWDWLIHSAGSEQSSRFYLGYRHGKLRQEGVAKMWCATTSARRRPGRSSPTR